jgi:hypothetical protein
MGTQGNRLLRARLIAVEHANGFVKAVTVK